MPLNEKQTRFAHAYIACGGNGRAAVIQAGYSPSSAAKRACDLVKHPEVQDIVQSHRDAVLKATENFDVVEELIGLYRMSVASGSLAVAHNALATPRRLQNLEPVRRMSRFHIATQHQVFLTALIPFSPRPRDL